MTLPDAQFTFEAFVVGDANRLAVSAARNVSEHPGAVYNPLFVFGPPGLGKTHLLAAIGHRAQSLHPTLSVVYVTLEGFVEELHLAIATGQAEAFKRRYLTVGLLLLDDVQALSGRRETQSEVLRVFNALQSSGRQIVMASDRAPADIADVDDRLLNRLSGGLIVDLGAPDHGTRVAILQRKCADRRTSFGHGVLEELARGSSASVREMEAALHRLIARQSRSAEPLSVAEVRDVIGGAVAVGPSDEFTSFLQDVASGVAASVDGWRLRLGERIAWWSGQGFRTAILEQALELPEAPDVPQLDAAFAAVTERLRALESQAIAVNPSLAGQAVFRDPDRLPEAERLVRRALAATDPPPGPLPEYSMASLVRTAGNRAAMHAAATITDAPGRAANPLLIVGPTASGKTHLAHAIGNVLAARHGAGRSIACVSGSSLVDELTEAIHQERLESWRSRFGAVDALIIDGLQAIDGREAVQDELLRLLTAVCAEQRPVVLTSDRPLSAYLGIADRLRTVVERGLVVTMAPPGPADRLGRHTPVPEGDEAAAPTIDAPADPTMVPEEREPVAVGAGVTEATSARRALDSFFFDSEKVVAEWPEPTGRLLEDLG
ncbi:MAG: ATP-binding protein [Gemmatimonadaceae bacterium]|nr:ATP-binding protein [Gemmatimonadaceae bacterium]